QISPLGDMVPVMAGIALYFRVTRQPRVGLVYVGDGAMSTGAFHEGINFAAVQQLPLVVICENNGYAYSTPTRLQTRAARLADKAAGYGIPGVTADGNDVVATYQATREAVARARAGEGPTLVELVTYRRRGHAEHDNQSYVPAGEIERWEGQDPLDRYLRRLREEWSLGEEELADVVHRIDRELDEAVDSCLEEPFPDPSTALTGVYADPPTMPLAWYRRLSPRSP
ncbi:MAG: thiamine pyrophosphate-dependent dehydrogenase E1 component subunit alpha, partial [Gemmatimonadales bacterium]